MEKALIKGYIAKRVAKEFKDGDFVTWALVCLPWFPLICRRMYM